MADRAFGEVEGDDPLTAKYRSLDFFPTPPWASRAGAEMIAALDPHAKTIIEPAAGMGHMADALAETFGKVYAFDIHDYGRGYQLADWLDPALNWPEHDWLVTNPPFKHAQAFAELGIQRARRGVALLCRLAFIETIGRYRLMRDMQVFAPFSERVAMVLGRWDPEIGTATAHAWFVWAKPGARGINLPGEAFAYPQVRLIAPGTRDRLWRPSDPAQYGELAAKPLDEQRDLWGQPGDGAEQLLIGL